MAAAKEQALVIVESPAKAKTIAGYLGNGFVVESSIGHIRDLPRSSDDVPAEYKGTEVAKLGVDVEHDFKPIYVVDADKRQHIAKLKKLLADADRLYLATDEDREGESIAWHLEEVLKPKVPVHRMVFHEITKKAIQQAIESPRTIDRRLVQAQEARRVLDRLYGWEVSPVLWRKVLPKLSAGRVQSVATRVLVERERERMSFVVARYWDLAAKLDKKTGEGQLTAQLVSVDGKRVASGKDFDEKGALSKDVVVLDETRATKLAEGLEGGSVTVKSIERKPFRRSPSAPFMTSTLQQEAGRKLRFSAKRAMSAAQRLYEAGYITYMRTDSTTLSTTAIDAARKLIADLYGRDFVPNAPRTYANKVKNAQEAHEAIRPAGETWKLPDDVAKEVGFDEAKVYELIWKRTVASQMADVRGETISVRFAAKSQASDLELSASGNTVEFPGFYRAYVEGSDDPDGELESREKHLPVLAEGEALAATKVLAEGHETQPPARYTEASLVRRLEELGVGRPSTYASTLSTIQDREYVFKKGTALVPSFKAFAVVTLLERHFPELVDYAFTAKMEDDLDGIANGSQDSVPWLKRFYFGTGTNPKAASLELGLRALVSEHLGDIDARAVNSIAIGKDEGGVEIIARVGKYGPYVQRGDDKASIPEDLPPDELTVSKALSLLSAPSGDNVLGNDPTTGEQVVVKNGRFGAYVQRGEADAKGERPKTASLFRTMSPSTVTLEDALKLLELPRTVGADPADGVTITAQNGRYGPYIQKGTDSRSLESENQLFDITLEQALAILAQPKDRRRRAAAAGPLRELGEDPVSKKNITVREGRFGPYVTDGETIASLRRTDAIETLTADRAQELLAEKRGRGPSTKAAKPKRGAKKTKSEAVSADGEATEAKSTAKKASKSGDAGVKTAAKKVAAKKTTPKKAPAKKAAAKKATKKATEVDDTI